MWNPDQHHLTRINLQQNKDLVRHHENSSHSGRLHPEIASEADEVVGLLKIFFIFVDQSEAHPDG